VATTTINQCYCKYCPPLAAPIPDPTESWIFNKKRKINHNKNIAGWPSIKIFLLYAKIFSQYTYTVIFVLTYFDSFTLQMYPGPAALED